MELQNRVHLEKQDVMDGQEGVVVLGCLDLTAHKVQSEKMGILDHQDLLEQSDPLVNKVQLATTEPQVFPEAQDHLVVLEREAILDLKDPKDQRL